MAGRGERPGQAGEDAVGAAGRDVAGALGAFGFDPGPHPEPVEPAAALGCEQGEPVGYGALLPVGGPVLDLDTVPTRGARDHGGRSATVEVDRGVRAGLDHHLAQLVQAHALGEGRLPTVDAEQVHPRAVLGEADGHARGARGVVVLARVLGPPVDDEHLTAVQRGVDLLVLGGPRVVVDTDRVAHLQFGQGLGAVLPTDQDEGVVGDLSFARLVHDLGDHAVGDHDLQRPRRVLGGPTAAVASPQRGERGDLARAQRRLVDRVQRRCLAGGQLDGALEEHLADRAEPVGGEDRGGFPVVAGDRRLDQFTVPHGHALRGTGGVDVEEVAVHRGDRFDLVRLLAHRRCFGHLSGEQVVHADSAGEVGGQQVALQPVGRPGVGVGPVGVEGGQRDTGGDRAFGLEGLQSRRGVLGPGDRAGRWDLDGLAEPGALARIVGVRARDRGEGEGEGQSGARGHDGTRA